jgi:hypothetical protein
VDDVQGKPLKIEWKRISNSLTVMDSAEYDLLHGRYRALEALLGAFDIRLVQIVYRYYDRATEEQFKTMPKRSCEEAFDKLLDRAVLITDEHHNPHWTLLTPMHEIAAMVNR